MKGGIFKPPSKKMTGLLFILSALFLTGCSTLPARSVKVLSVPMRTLPPTEPGLIRLPVVLLFPSGSEVIHHVAEFFENGLRPKRDHPVQVPGVHLRFSATDLWAKIQEPIYLDKNIWLLIRPQTLSLGSVKTDPHHLLTAHAGLETTADPEVVFGPKPETVLVPMPPLGKFISGAPTFQAVSNTFISYKEVNAHLKDPRLKLIGMVLKGTGQKVTLEGIRLYGSGGQVIVEVKLSYNPLIINLGSKPAKLTVYLRGTPHYLLKHRAFDLPDLNYDIKSSDLMVQMADLVFKGNFKNQLRQIARFPIGPQMDELKEKINLALNRPLGSFIRLSAKVTSFKVLGGLADNEGIEVRVSIKGTAALEVTWN